MHIARIIEYFPPRVGGMERHSLILSCEQIKLGHAVDVFIGFGNNSDYSDKFFDSDHEKLKVYKIPFQLFPLYSKLRRLSFNLWAYCKIKKTHVLNPYNVIHAHGDIVEARLAGALSQKLNIPAVLTIHGGLNPKILDKKNAKIFEKLKHIICVSEEIKRSLLAIGVNSKKISVISSGVYLHDFDKPRPILDYSKPAVISMGALTEQKGFRHLIDAFKKIKRETPSASLLIVGNGPEHEDLIERAEHTNGIHILGELSHKKVVELLLGCDIFVLASITMPGYYEGTPTSLIEAMAAGLPIVATESGGVPYLIKDGINGILVEEKNSEILAQAIIKLIKDKDLGQKMRAKNLEDVKYKNWPVIVEQITSLYDDD